MRNTHLHSMNQTSIIFVALLCVFSLCLFAVNAPAQTLGEVKRRTQEREANPRAEAISDNAAQQDDAAAQQENSPSRAEQRAQAIVGSWLSTLANGAKGLITFNADGTVIYSVQGEVSTAPNRPPHTSLHGVWRYLGGRRFGFTVWDIWYDANTSQLIQYGKLRGEVTLNWDREEGNVRAKLEFFNPQGDVILSREGTANFKRIKYEPLD